jgi:hypothetical protein
MNMDIGAILSIIAILWTVYVYYVHERKLKKQEELLNDYRLKKATQEEEDRKKAFIVANAYSLGTGDGTKYRIRVCKRETK